MVKIQSQLNRCETFPNNQKSEKNREAKVADVKIFSPCKFTKLSDSLEDTTNIKRVFL